MGQALRKEDFDGMAAVGAAAANTAFDAFFVGNDSMDFDYGSVEDPVDLMLARFRGVKLTREQAMAVLSWHQHEMSEAHAKLESMVLLRALSELIGSKNVRMEVHAMALVTGIAEYVGYSSQTDVARELGVTRAAVSKCAKKWGQILELVILKFRRNDETREHCSAAQKRDHWRSRTAADFARQ